MPGSNDSVQIQIQPEIVDVDATEAARQIKSTLQELTSMWSDLLKNMPESAAMSKPVEQAMRRVESAYRSASKSAGGFVSDVEEINKALDENIIKRADAQNKISRILSVPDFNEDAARKIINAYENKKSIGPAVKYTKLEEDYTTLKPIIEELDRLRTAESEAQTEITRLSRALAEMDGKVAESSAEMNTIASSTTRFGASVEGLANAIDTSSGAEGKASEETSRLQMAYNATSKILRGLAIAAKSAFSTMKQVIQRVAKVVSELYNRFSKLFSGFTKGSKGMNFNSRRLFKTFLQFGLGVRSLYFLIRRMRTEFIKGMKQMAASFPEVNQQVSALTMAFNQMKGSAVTMIQPILASVIPVLVRVFNLLTAVMNRIAQFFAVLRGQKVIYKATAANVDYAESVDGVGDSAKEAKKELAEYDELLVIPQDTGSTSGGGGGGGSEDPYGFEEVPIDAISDFAQKLKDAWESADYEEVGRVIAEKLNSITQTIDDWILNKFEPKGIDWANRIARIGNGLFEKWDAELAGKTVSDFFNSLFNIINEFVTTFNWSQAGDKIGTAIVSAISNFDAKKAGETIRNLFEGIFEAGISLLIQNPGGALGSKLAEFINSLFDPNSGTLGSFAGGIINNVSSFFRGIFENVNWDDIKGFLSTNFNSLADSLGFSEETKTRIAQVAEPIMGIFQGIIDFIQKIDFEKVFGSILELLGSIASVFESVWGILEPVLEYAVNDMFPRLNESTGTLFESISTFLDAIGPVLSPIMEIMMEIGTITTEFVNSGISGILQTMAKVLAPIAKILGKILEVVQPILERISGTVLFVFSEVLEMILSLLEPITQILEAVFEVLAPIIDLLGPILDIIMDIIELALKPIIHLITAFVKLITGDFEGAGEEMQAMFGDIQESVNNLKEHFTQFKDKLVEIWNNIVTTITEVKDKIVEIWNTIKEKISGIVEGIKTAITTAWDNIKTGITEKIEAIKTGITTIWTSIKTWITTTVDNIKEKVVGKFEAVKTGVTTIFEKLKTALSRIWQAIWNVIKAPINWILAGVESLANGVVRGINAVIGALNGLHFSVPKWIPLIGGKSFGFNIGYLSEVSLPRLAQGAVIPPNKEFLAVLGDQSAGTNVEAPLDTIKQALAEVFSEYGNTGQQNDIVLQLDGRTVARVVWSEEEKRYKQTGTLRPSYA